ncbi:MAG: sugar O-acyltransferase [Marinilabiliales bacterium]|nr:MAG: sugar O-acyltransferase [Marinilabiliales bacterium]
MANLNNKKLVIIGGEGNGGVIAACIEDNRKRFNDYECMVYGFVNDFETQVNGYPVLGGTDDIPKLLKNEDLYFMFAIHIIGRNVLSEQVFRKVNIPKNRYAIVLHKTALIADNAILEPGVFVMSNSYIGPKAHIGQCSLVMANSIIGHDTKCGPVCHFSASSITSSYVTIGLCSDVTLNAKVLEKRNIGNFAVAGAASLITKDIPDYEIHVGSPAKFMKRVRED